MNTTILLFHPDFSRSKANRALANAARALPGLTIIDMTSLYPDGHIDVDAEVKRLLGIERLVIQFPVQWYSTPSLLKTWQDTVLTRMYYINAKDEGEKMRGLPVMVAATAGNEPSAYSAEGINLFPLAELLRPLQATAHRCYWVWSEPFLVYRANRLGEEELAHAGQQYVERLKAWG